jgi:Amt family ammonium transporter
MSTQLAWSAVEWLSFGRPSTLGLISGAVAGLVAITPASGTAGMLGALCIGGAAGVATFFASTRLKEAIDIYDDALDAFGVHGVGGIVGALLTGVWCAPGLGGTGFGTFVHSGGRSEAIGNIGWQLGVQAASVALAVAWSTVGTLLALKAADVAHGGFHCSLRLRAIRVTEEVEQRGLDEAQFAEAGYNLLSSDMRISVEVGPLRGRRGHGLQLYSHDEDGTRHPISLSASDDAHDALAEQLLAAGGFVDIVCSASARATSFRAKEVSVHGSDAAGVALAASATVVELQRVPRAVVE